jgi:hypothetical protein
MVYAFLLVANFQQSALLLGCCYISFPESPTRSTIHFAEASLVGRARFSIINIFTIPKAQCGACGFFIFSFSALSMALKLACAYLGIRVRKRDLASQVSEYVGYARYNESYNFITTLSYLPRLTGHCKKFAPRLVH